MTGQKGTLYCRLWRRCRTPNLPWLLHPKLFQLQFSSSAPARQPEKSSSSFFTVPIRNANTRAAYYRAIQQFLAWVERAGYQQLEDIKPITVAAYIENLTAPGRAAHGQTAHGGDPDAVFLAYRKRSPGHESGPGSQDREIFADRRQNAGISFHHIIQKSLQITVGIPMALRTHQAGALYLL